MEPTEYIKAKTQEIVGTLLASKSLLLRLRDMPAYASEADRLYIRQLAYEDQISSLYAIAEKVQAGTQTVAELGQATAMLSAMAYHNSQVKDLAVRAGLMTGTPNYIWYALIGVGVLILIGMLKGGR